MMGTQPAAGLPRLAKCPPKAALHHPEMEDTSSNHKGTPAANLHLYCNIRCDSCERRDSYGDSGRGQFAVVQSCIACENDWKV